MRTIVASVSRRYRRLIALVAFTKSVWPYAVSPSVMPTVSIDSKALLN